MASVTTLGFRVITRYTGDGIRRARRDIDGIRRALNNNNRLFSRMAANTLDSASAMSLMATKSIPLAVAGLGLLAGIASALTVVLTAGLAGAFIGLGAFALKSDAQVSGAFKHMMSVVGSTVKQAAQPMKAFLVQGILQATAAARTLGPQLRQAFAAAGPLIRPLVQSITNFAQGAMPGLVAALRNAGPILDSFARGMGTLGRAVGQVFQRLTQNPKAVGRNFEQMAAALGRVVTSLGNLTAALAENEAAMRVFVFMMDTVSKSTNTLARGVSGVAAIRVSKDENSIWNKNLWGLISGLFTSTASKATQFSNALDPIKTAAGAAGANLRKVADAMRQLKSITLASLGGMIAFEQAIDDAAQAAAENAGKLKMQNGQLKLGGQGARDAARGLMDLASQTLATAKEAGKLAGGQAKANAVINQGRAAFIRAATAAGLTKKQADSLARSLGLIPKAKSTKVTAPGATKSKSQADALKRSVQGVPGRKSVTFTTNAAAVAAAIRRLAAAAAAAKANVPFQFANGGPVGKFANGGPVGFHSGSVRGPGGPRADSIPAMLSNGEYVLQASAVRMIGVRNLDAWNKGKSSGHPSLPSGGLSGLSRSSAGGATLVFAPVFNAPVYAKSQREFETMLVGAMKELDRKGRLKGITNKASR